jgi:acylphosphatase
LTGFVKNLRDGSVYIMSTGEKNKQDELINWCRQGPPAARVTGVSVKEEPLTDYPTFVIDRS